MTKPLWIPGLFLFRARLPAQGTGAEITGTLTDASGAAVPNAAITITNTQTNAQRALTSNSSGIYDAPSLPPGVYNVKVSSSGFRAEVRNNVDREYHHLRSHHFDTFGFTTDPVRSEAGF